METILISYVIARAYFRLGERHGKTRSGSALMGIITFNFAVFVGRLIFAAVTPKEVSDLESLTGMVLIFLFAILATWAIYRTLQYQWKREAALPPNDPAHATPREAK